MPRKRKRRSSDATTSVQEAAILLPRFGRPPDESEVRLAHQLGRPEAHDGVAGRVRPQRSKHVYSFKDPEFIEIESKAKEKDADGEYVSPATKGIFGPLLENKVCLMKNCGLEFEATLVKGGFDVVADQINSARYGDFVEHHRAIIEKVDAALLSPKAIASVGDNHLLSKAMQSCPAVALADAITPDLRDDELHDSSSSAISLEKLRK